MAKVSVQVPVTGVLVSLRQELQNSPLLPGSPLVEKINDAVGNLCGQLETALIAAGIAVEAVTIRDFNVLRREVYLALARAVLVRRGEGDRSIPWKRCHGLVGDLEEVSPTEILGVIDTALKSASEASPQAVPA